MQCSGSVRTAGQDKGLRTALLAKKLILLLHMHQAVNQFLSSRSLARWRRPINVWDVWGQYTTLNPIQTGLWHGSGKGGEQRASRKIIKRIEESVNACLRERCSSSSTSRIQNEQSQNQRARDVCTASLGAHPWAHGVGSFLASFNV